MGRAGSVRGCLEEKRDKVSLDSVALSEQRSLWSSRSQPVL